MIEKHKKQILWLLNNIALLYLLMNWSSEVYIVGSRRDFNGLPKYLPLVSGCNQSVKIVTGICKFIGVTLRLILTGWNNWVDHLVDFFSPTRIHRFSIHNSEVLESHGWFSD